MTAIETGDVTNPSDPLKSDQTEPSRIVSAVLSRGRILLPAIKVDNETVFKEAMKIANEMLFLEWEKYKQPDTQPDVLGSPHSWMHGYQLKMPDGSYSWNELTIECVNYGETVSILFSIEVNIQNGLTPAACRELLDQLDEPLSRRLHDAKRPVQFHISEYNLLFLRAENDDSLPYPGFEIGSFCQSNASYQKIEFEAGSCLCNEDRSDWLITCHRTRQVEVGTFVRSVLIRSLAYRYKLIRIDEEFLRFRSLDEINNPYINLRKAWMKLEQESQESFTLVNRFSSKENQPTQTELQEQLHRIRQAHLRTREYRAELEFRRVTASANLTEIAEYFDSRQADCLGSTRKRFQEFLTLGLLHLDKEFDAEMRYSAAAEEMGQTAREALSAFVQAAETEFVRYATVIVAAVGAVSLCDFFKARFLTVFRSEADSWPPLGRASISIVAFVCIFFVIAKLVYILPQQKWFQAYLKGSRDSTK
jgi:hypothetical protein